MVKDFKFKRINIKKFLIFFWGLLIFLSSSYIVKAATSDEVILSVTKPGAGYVNTQSGSLIVREEPSTSSRIITSLPKDSMIMIVERCGDFYKVQYNTSGSYGYVAQQYIREYDLDYYREANTTTSLNMREGAGTTYAIAASIPSHRRFPVLIVMSTWDYVLYGNKDGYVATQYTLKFHY